MDETIVAVCIRYKKDPIQIFELEDTGSVSHLHEFDSDSNA